MSGVLLSARPPVIPALLSVKVTLDDYMQAYADGGQDDDYRPSRCAIVRAFKRQHGDWIDTRTVRVGRQSITFFVPEIRTRVRARMPQSGRTVQMLFDDGRVRVGDLSKFLASGKAEIVLDMNRATYTFREFESRPRAGKKSDSGEPKRDYNRTRRLT